VIFCLSTSLGAIAPTAIAQIQTPNLPPSHFTPLIGGSIGMIFAILITLTQRNNP
jgi:hypothetical protein